MSNALGFHHIHSSIPDDVIHGGKKLRSTLMQAWAVDLGLEKDLIDFADIGEMVHNATLFHDDVIDQSEIRRDNPTLPKLIGNKKAVLYGDYALSKAMVRLVQLGETPLVENLAVTLKELVDGELIQMGLEFDTYTKVHYQAVAHKKTGSLLAWFMWVPVYLKTKNKKYFPFIEKMANTLAEIYQVIDDCLDYSNNSGKTIALDEKNENINFVHLMKKTYGLSQEKALEKSHDYVQALSKDLHHQINEFAKKLNFNPKNIHELIEFLTTRLK